MIFDSKLELKVIMVVIFIVTFLLVCYMLLPISTTYNLEDYVFSNNTYKVKFRDEIKKDFVNNSIESSNVLVNNDYVISSSTEDILKMSDAEFWNLISNGRFSSVDESNAAVTYNSSSEKTSWQNQMISIEVPVWKWKDSSKTEKISSTVKITVNKNLTQFFTDMFNELYSCEEKYVINETAVFSFRVKNNGTGTKSLSAHSYGVAIDFNWSTDGMGSRPVNGYAGVPYRSDKGLSNDIKSVVCTLDSNWLKVMQKYNFYWGGLWTPSYQDPMHFSLVGDGQSFGSVETDARGVYR